MNHLWQSTGFAILAAILALILRGSPAKVRYWIWLSASLKFLVPLTLLLSLGSMIPRAVPSSVPSIAVPLAPVLLKAAEPFTPAPAVQPSTDWKPAAIGFFWALGFLVIASKRCRSWLQIRTLLRASSPVELPVPIPVVVTPDATESGVVGFLRPVLVLPAGLIDQLNTHQLHAVLAHEMCHVRRRDNLFAAIHMCVEAIFWFHPLVWWIGSRMLEERERACDEEVLQLGCEPSDYVEGILKVCRLYRESGLPCVSGVTGADVKQRLRAILAGTIAHEWGIGKKAALTAIGAASLTAPVVIGMLNAAPAALRFEVASIRPCEPDQGPNGFRFAPGQMRVVCLSLRNLIGTAYVTNAEPGTEVIFARDPISGGPAWVGTNAYDIVAKAAGNPAGAVMSGPMLRSLLEERFKLKLHSETKEIPVYELTAAKSGFKLKPLQGSCTLVDIFSPEPVPVDQRCGWHKYNPHGVAIQAASLDDIAAQLTRTRGMQRPVINRTGISGRFDFKLDFTPSEGGIAFAGNSTDAPAAAASDSPSIFTAMQEQIGLKLEPAKGQGQFLVIDHVERPTEN